MRPTPALLALLLALGPSNATAAVSVDSLQRTVETARFRVRFDTAHPDRILELVWKPWSPVQNLAAVDLGASHEYFGETLTGLAGTALVDPVLMSEASWMVTAMSADGAELACASRSEGGPRVTSRYTFRDADDWFTVVRTIDWDGVFQRPAYQPYVARLAPVGPYRAVRWRDDGGTVRLSGFCFAGCAEPGWDGQWSEVELRVGDVGLASALVAAGEFPPPSGLVHGYGPETSAVWAGPLLVPGPEPRRVHRFAVRFSQVPGQVTSLDSLRAALLPGPLAAPSPAGAAPLLAVWPVPVRGGAEVRWVQPLPGPARVEVFDTAGRALATLAAGEHAAGAHTARWHAPAPGVYLVRVRTAAGEATRRIVAQR